MLTPEQMAKVTEFLAKKWGKNGCHQCGKKAFGVIGRGAFMFLDPHNQGQVMNAARPLIAIVCQNCGNVLFLDGLHFELDLRG